MKLENGFKVIGISTKTTNKDNKSKEDLGELWEKFNSENIVEKIPNKESKETFMIYTDYKSNYTDEYTAILGVPVSSLNEVPSGFVGREFDQENFKKYEAKGKMPDAVLEVWKEIWKNDNNLNRKYSHDIEVYGKNSQSGNNSEVEIYLAVEK